MTDAGREFISRIAPAIAEIRAALDQASLRRKVPSGRLRINASVQGARAIAPLVLDFLGRYPEMEIDLVTEGRLVDIVAEGFDLGIRSADLVPRDMIALPFGPPQRHAIVASPAWLAAHPAPLSPADLNPAECLGVRLPGGTLLRWPMEKDGLPLFFETRGRLTVDEATVARLAVMAGVGIGYFIETDVAEDIAAGRLVRLLPHWTPQRHGLCLYYPQRRNPSAGFTAFLALVRAPA